MPVTDKSVGVPGTRTAPAVEWGLLCSIDSRRYFTALGEGWEDELGWTREELFSRPFTDFVHPTERDATLASMEAAWRGDSAAIALDTSFRMRGGRWHRVRWSPSLDRGDVAAVPAPPARTAWRDYPVIGAALRALVAVTLICTAVGVGFVLTSFAPGDPGNPPPPVTATNRIPVGMGGPVTGSGPTLRAGHDATPPPGLVGVPLGR